MGGDESGGTGAERTYYDAWDHEGRLIGTFATQSEAFEAETKSNEARRITGPFPRDDEDDPPPPPPKVRPGSGSDTPTRGGLLHLLTGLLAGEGLTSKLARGVLVLVLVVVGLFLIAAVLGWVVDLFVHQSSG